MSTRQTSQVDLAPQDPRSRKVWPFFLLGVTFGVTLTKAEVVSWFRIQ